MADSGSIVLTASILPEEYRKTFTNEIFSYTPADATEGWYIQITKVTTTSGDLLGDETISKKAGLAVGGSKAEAAATDLCKFLFIKNTGTTNGTNSTTDSVYICLDAGTAAHNLADSIEIPAGMSWYARLPSTQKQNIHAIAGQANAAGTGGGNVQCIVGAIIDDV